VETFEPRILNFEEKLDHNFSALYQMKGNGIINSGPRIPKVFP
jgi:hypothetical protein